MKARSAKNKGNRFEDYLVQRLRETIDKDTHRTPASGAGLDKNDIRIPSLNIEIEAKNCSQNFSISQDWAQTERQLTTGNTGVLIVRHPAHPEFKKTLVVMDLEDWLELLENQGGKKEVTTSFDPRDKWVIRNAIEANKKVIKLFEN